MAPEKEKKPVWSVCCVCFTPRLVEETIARTLASTNQSKGVDLSTNQIQTLTWLFPHMLQATCFCFEVWLVYDVISACSDWFCRVITSIGSKRHTQRKIQLPVAVTPVLTYFAISVEFLHWILLGETDSSHQFDTLWSRQGSYLITRKRTTNIGSLDSLCPPWLAGEIYFGLG